MKNLIEHKVDSDKLAKLREQVEASKHRKPSFFKKFLTAVLVLSVLAVSVYFVSNQNKAEAVQFGLGNDYEAIIEMNANLASNVPLSIDSISTSEAKGDKRVVALLLFFEKYKSPMAKASIAKAFVDGADKNGFGDKWYLLPAIAGIESSFGRIIPAHGKVVSYNAWGWSGGSKFGRWSYFNSWEDAATVVSAGMAKNYGKVNLVPDKMMKSYCPPCAHPSSKGIWAKTVNKYIAEMKQVHDSL